MTTRQIALVVHSLALLSAMTLLVPALTGWNSQLGFLLILSLYAFGFCLPVAWLHVWRRHDGRVFSEKLRWRDWWILPLLLLQVGCVAIAAFMPNTALLTTHGAMLAGMVALVLAPLEETAWRGGFRTVFANQPRTGFWLAWTLSSAAYLPFLRAQGIVFEGSAWGLIAATALLGLLWGWIAWRTGSVFYTAIAHVMSKTVFLWVLFNENGFVAPHP